MLSMLSSGRLTSPPTIASAMERRLPAVRVPGTVECPGCEGRISGNKGLCRECGLKWEAYKEWTRLLGWTVNENGWRKRDEAPPESLLPLPSPPSLPDGLEKMVNEAARRLLGVGGVGIPPSL